MLDYYNKHNIPAYEKQTDKCTERGIEKRSRGSQTYSPTCSRKGKINQPMCKSHWLIYVVKIYIIVPISQVKSFGLNDSFKKYEISSTQT